MKTLYVFAMAATSVSAGAHDPGTPCLGRLDDCGDKTAMCCGIASGGRIVNDYDTISKKPVPN